MINKHPRLNTPLIPFMQRLNRSYNYFLRLCTVSQTCQTSYQWLEVNKANPMPLLDFDVICGSLPSMAIEQHAQESESFSDEDLLLLRDMPGPYTIRYVLGGLKELYLPQGTISDLLNWKERKSGDLSVRAKTLLEKLDQAASTGDPKILLGDRQVNEMQIIDILRDEISNISNRHEDLSQLDMIVEKASPINDQFLKKSYPPKLFIKH